MPVRWGAVDPEVERDFEAHLARPHGCATSPSSTAREGEDAQPPPERWARHVRVLTPDPRWRGPNGKVGGAMTGIRAARHERVVLADDDVRYDGDQLAAVVRALHDADLVLPQNHPTAFPWWAWWESGRMLLNRALATDWPGTCALRRSTMLARAAGRPTPCTRTSRWRARSRPSGGGWPTGPTCSCPGTRRRSGTSCASGCGRRTRTGPSPPLRRWGWPSHRSPWRCCAADPHARRRGRGASWRWPRRGAAARAAARAFPPHTPLAAPLWVLERGVCAWLALLRARAVGPVYHGRRMPLAAHSSRWLTARSSDGPCGVPSRAGADDATNGPGRRVRDQTTSTPPQEER